MAWVGLLVPGRVLGQRPTGIDVSSYQHSITWSSVKGAGISYAWSKATEGTGYQDAYFVGNETGGKAAGVFMGAYHFCHPELNTASVEASYFWNFAGAYILRDGKSLMPMLDVEATAFNGNVGASSLSDWINQWCTAVENLAAAAGVTLKPVVYISACNANHLNTSVASTTIPWIANYNGLDPQSGNPWNVCNSSSYEVWGSGVWQLWQYSSSGSVPGISGNVDMDVFNGTAATLFSTLVIGGGNSASFVSSSVPGGVVTGKTFTASLTLNNSGTGAWTNTGANPYRLGSQNPQDNSTWGFNRVELPGSPIAPGANATFTFTATAPMAAGSYAFSWRMVQEGAQWFGDTFTTYLNVVIPGPGTNYGSYSIDSGAINSTSRDGSYVSFSTCGVTGWYSYVCNTAGTYFNRDIRWMPNQPPYGFTGRGYIAATTLVPSIRAEATSTFYAVDAAGNDLAGPITGTINQCAYSCTWPTVYSGVVNVSSFGGFRCNTLNCGPAPSGGCNTTCGSFAAGFSLMQIQAARWQYIDDWTCLGSYGSASVSDTANRSFNEANLYLYPAVDTSHGNVLTAGLGLNGKTPGRVTTGDCNNANTLNFGGAGNGVSPDGNAAAYGNANNADAYGFAWVFAPAGAGPQMVLGSDDGNRLWVNGVLRNDNNASRGLTRDQDNTGAVSLPAGWSRVLFKVHNFTGGFQGTVSLRNGGNVNLNEPSVNYYDLGGYYSYGLGYEQDEWYPQIVVNTLYGTSSPTNGQAFYGNNTTVSASGVSSVHGPVPYWRTMQFQWGYGLGNADSDYADVSGTPTAATWSHTASGVTGHRRLHFFAVSQSGRTSFQNSGSSGGSVFQDAGNYARYYDVFVDNQPPLSPSFASVAASSISQIELGWSIPRDQGVNVAPASAETAGEGGNQDAQNWYLVGDVGVQVYRNGTPVSSWGTGTGLSDNGLNPNTAYTYTLEARDNSTGLRGNWHNSTGPQGQTVAWTLSVPPTAGSIAVNPSQAQAGSNVTWTAVNGFGAGQVQYYRYAWDTSATHAWTETEPQWSGGTLDAAPTSGGSWYLHLKGYNGADVGNGTYDYAVNVAGTAACSQTNAIVGIAANQDGTFTITFTGSSQAQYYVVATSDLGPVGSWAPVDGTTNTVTAPSGRWTCTVTNSGAQRFYRSVAITPCP